MTEKHTDRRQKLLEFAAYLKCVRVNSCRLVHYCGGDWPNAIDVPLSDVESQVVGCVDEGFMVQWLAAGNRLYIAVQEPGCPVPPWEKVFAEEPLVDVDELLKGVGLQ